MEINFYKYEGAGNDFILIDNRKGEFDHFREPEYIHKLCDRHFGIGADGLMTLQSKEGYDFEMLYYNADGRPGTMCGNGGRCITAFAKYLGIIETTTNFLAVDGPHYAKISEKGDWVSLKMIDVEQILEDGGAFSLNTGSPHYVLSVKGIRDLDIFSEGRKIRYNNTYRAEGINVNFVEDHGEYYEVRTYERGVENETFACGTGVTAVAMSMAKHNNKRGKIETALKVHGGNLNVRFDYDGKKFTEVYLEGPATFVFQGMINQD